MSWFNLGGKSAATSPAATSPAAVAMPPAEAPATAAATRELDAIRKAQPFIAFAPDGHIDEVNEAFCLLSGYAADELRGQAYGFLLHQKEREAGSGEALWSKLGRGESETGQFRLAGKAGKEIWLQASFVPVPADGARPGRILMTGSDITGLVQKAMQDAVELKLRSGIMDMTSIVSYADTKGDILSVNEKFIEVSKYSRDELIGKPHNTTRHPDMPKDVFKELWSTIGRGKTFRGVIKNRAKDGTPYYVDAVIAPILGENGKPKRYLGVRYDITEMELERQNMRGLLGAIDNSFAYIEFSVTGTVLTANRIFLNLMGYTSEDIVGKPHRIFVEPAYASSPAYMQFWSDLNAGKPVSDIFKRITRSGQEVWIQAVYAPVQDETGRVVKVVKIATDVTTEKLKAADFSGQLAAISKSQATIEFTLEGKIIQANENFCSTLGYSQAEIAGQHHSLFVEPMERSSLEYRQFWERLGRGEFATGLFRRIGKGGKEIWIQASYNPILDLNGKPFKVVKYATDVTEQVRNAKALQAAVEETQQVVSAAKENDLTRRIPLEGKSGELQLLCAGVNGLIDTMTALIASTSEAAGTISSAVAEITSGTDDLSRRTESQASSLEETSASMEEIASTIRQNSENAQQASKLAVDARNVASEGGEIVTRAVSAMSRIEESSGKVSDIIGVIDEIAFQTNLLALNAAVEAARAGDAGRGFAVVASEVRSLAQRSSQAAKDIKALIVQSGAQVKDGVKLVNDTGVALNEIVGAVRSVTDIVAEIANASREQAVGVEEINKAISQMDEMTQQNSALVEENAAACRLLQEQAEDMAARMALFRLDAEHSAAPAARPAPRKPAPAAAKPERPAAAAARPPVRRVAAGGGRAGAAALQSELRSAFAEDKDWKEF